MFLKKKAFKIYLDFFLCFLGLETIEEVKNFKL